MAGIAICEPTELYNLLTRMQTPSKPSLVNRNYLLLVDTRPRSEYDESHITVAKFAVKTKGGEFTTPGFGIEVPTLQQIIVYDSDTVSTVENTSAVNCARMFTTKGSRCTVKVLKGGFERFSAEYPFLRTQKIIYTPLELEKLPRYPTELLPLSLYLGDRSHAYNAALNHGMKVTAHVNAAEELYPAYPATISTLHLPGRDQKDQDMLQHFQEVCDYIDKRIGSSQRVLVYSEMGISRSAVVCIAFLMKYSKINLRDAYREVSSKRPQIRPLSTFIQQLSQWEEQLFGKSLTDISAPEF